MNHRLIIKCVCSVKEMPLRIVSGAVNISSAVFSTHYQDYRWWWRTFLVSGGSAFYVLIYAVFYFVNKVKAQTMFELKYPQNRNRMFLIGILLYQSLK